MRLLHEAFGENEVQERWRDAQAHCCLCNERGAELGIVYTIGDICFLRISEHEIRILTLEDGRCPFEEWYDSISDIKTSAVIEARITRMKSGNLSGCKPVGKGVSELVIDFGPGYRIYFAEADRVVVVLLCGGDKSSQIKDIKKAQDLWEIYSDDAERFQ